MVSSKSFVSMMNTAFRAVPALMVGRDTNIFRSKLLLKYIIWTFIRKKKGHKLACIEISYIGNLVHYNFFHELGSVCG